MKKWLVCLKDQRGTAFPLIIAVALACLLILCGVAEFFRLSLIVSGMKEALQDTVVVVVNDNYINVYCEVWEGYSGGYYMEGYGFEESADTGNIYYHLGETLRIRREGGIRVKYTGGTLEYKILGLDITIRNAPLTPSDPVNAQRFETDTVVWPEVPVQFVGKIFPPMKMELKVRAEYTEAL